MTPHMSTTHAAIVVSILQRHNSPRCLEWGSGGSTVQFSPYAGQWHALETSPKWSASVSAAASPSATIHLFDQGIAYDHEPSYQDALRSLPLTDYINWPLDNGRFDFILVDGRKRSDCVGVAKQVVSDGGVILLHDAQRPHYHVACEDLFKIRHRDEFGDELWEMHKGTPVQ